MQTSVIFGTEAASARSFPTAVFIGGLVASELRVYGVLRTSQNSCSTTFVNKGKKKGRDLLPLLRGPSWLVRC
jgi:hypothetical protein